MQGGSVRYQKISQAKEVKAIRTQRAAEAAFARWLASLDREQYELLLAESPKELKTIKPLLEDAGKREETSKERVNKLIKLGAKAPRIKDQQKQWLNQRIAELERDHATKQELLEHADVYGEDPKKLKWETKIIEAALTVCTQAHKKLKK